MLIARKNRRRKLLIVTCFGLLLLLLLLNASVGIHPKDNGGCISVSWDKMPMLFADKAVLRIGEYNYTIDDIAVVRSIVSETSVATCTDLRFWEQNACWIDIYCGDVLIRSMKCEADFTQVVVYEKDILHGIFPSVEGKGMVYLSEELIATIKKQIGNNWSKE